MKKLSMLGLSGVAGTVIALTVAGTAFAWHPQGKITKTVQDVTTNSQVSSATDASGAITVAPGDTLKYTVTVNNAAQPAANNDNDMAFIVMTDNLPAGVAPVSGPSQITENIGTLAPQKSWTKDYVVKVTDQKDGDVITNQACFTGDSIVKDNKQSDCSTVVVKVRVPSFSCDLLSVTKGDNRTVTVNDFKQTAKNATFANVVIDWGDKTAPLTTSASPVGQKHQYAADGTYNVAATAHFTVNGQDKTATGQTCAQTVSFTTATPPPTPTPQPPATLPNTGAGDVIVPAFIVSVLGYAAHLFRTKRHAL
jgi:uncharacterized repeat protein (TIGR01451 family)